MGRSHLFHLLRMICCYGPESAFWGKRRGKARSYFYFGGELPKCQTWELVNEDALLENSLVSAMPGASLLRGKAEGAGLL